MKKKLLGGVVFCFITFTLPAQDARDILLEGTTGLYLQTRPFEEDGEWVNSWLWLDLSGGYFVSRGIALGPTMSIYIDHYKLKGTEDTETRRDFYFGLMVGFYFPTGTRIVPFIRPEVAYNSGTYIEKTGDMVTFDHPWSGLRTRLVGGIDILLSEFVALCAGAWYSYYLAWNDPEYNYHLVQAFLGIDVFLPTH